MSDNSMPREILGKLSENSKFIDVISAFTEAQVTSNAQLKVIAQNTADLLTYFKDKDGFSKEFDELIERKLETKMDKLEKNLVIKFFAIVGSLAIILGVIAGVT